MIIGSSISADVVVRGALSAESQLVGVGAASDSAASKLAGLALGGATIATAALIAVGVTSLKMAGDFEQGVNRLRTGAGDVTDSFASLSKSILQVSTNTGILTPQLIASDYLILSAGQRGAQAYATLSAAAQGAVIEQAKVVDVTQILTTLQTNFGLATYTATQYMDGLISAVSHGKITLENLSTAMSPILPNAKELGIHFADVAAAMSDMTNQGIPAAQAATALRFVFQSMILPTKASQKAMVEWGLDSAKVAQTMKTSLPDALQMYIDAAKRAGPEGSKPFIDALASMMGGGQRAAKALFALSQSMGTWRTDIAQVNAAMRDSSPTVNGWAIAQSNLNVQLDKAHAVLDAVFIKIGTDLFPMAEKFLQNVVVPAIKNFSDWTTNTSGLHDAFATLFAVMGSVITDGTAIIKFFAAAGPQGTILKDVLIGLGLAVGALKFVELAASIAVLTTVTIPAALVKFGLMTAAATAQTAAQLAASAATDAAAVQLSLWTGVAIPATGAAAGLATAETGVATGAAGVTASVTAMLAPLALAAVAVAGVTLAAKQLNNQLADNGNLIAQQNRDNPLDIGGGKSALDKIAAQNAKDAAAAAAQAYKDLQAQIRKAWNDAESLAQWFIDHHRIPGFDPVNITTADAKVLVLKSHLDDVAMPTIIGVLTPQVEAARQKVIDLKSHLDDIKGAWAPSIGTISIDTAKLHAIDLKSHLDDTRGPFVPSIGVSSIDAATAKAIYLHSQLDDVAHTYYANVITQYSSFGAPPVVPFRGFASGGPVLQTGLALVHKGEYVLPASSASSLPGLATRMGAGAAPVINVYPPDIVLDGVRLSRALMPHIAQQIRVNAGVK